MNKIKKLFKQNTLLDFLVAIFLSHIFYNITFIDTLSGEFDVIKMCLDDRKLICESPKMAKYCFDICMGEIRNLELAKYFLDNTNPSTSEYHEMSSLYYEDQGDIKKSLKHSFQAFFLEPENIVTISRLMEIKKRANFGTDIFDYLIINLYITQRGGKPIIPKHGDSSLSFNSDKITSDLVAFSEQNWMALESGDFSHFFDKIDDHLSSNNEGMNDIIASGGSKADLKKYARSKGFKDLRDDAILKVLEGDCETAIGAHSIIEGNKITVEAELFSLDGSQIFYEKKSGNVDMFKEIGTEVGNALKIKSNNSYKK